MRFPCVAILILVLASLHPSPDSVNTDCSSASKIAFHKHLAHLCMVVPSTFVPRTRISRKIHEEVARTSAHVSEAGIDRWNESPTARSQNQSMLWINYGFYKVYKIKEKKKLRAFLYIFLYRYFGVIDTQIL